MVEQPPPPSGPRHPHHRGFAITLRHITLGRTSLDEWSAHHTDLYLTTLTTDIHPCPRRDSNPQSQQESGRRPTDHSANGIGYTLIGYPKSQPNISISVI